VLLPNESTFVMKKDLSAAVLPCPVINPSYSRSGHIQYRTQA